MDFDDRPFWKPRDLAELLAVDRSTIYRMIDEGQLASVRVGQRTVRVPARAIAELLGVEEPVVGPSADQIDFDPDDRLRAFTERTGHTPQEHIEAWKSGAIEDNPENSADTVEALAIRELLAGLTVDAR